MIWSVGRRGKTTRKKVATQAVTKSKTKKINTRQRTFIFKRLKICTVLLLSHASRMKKKKKIVACGSHVLLGPVLQLTTPSLCLGQSTKTNIKRS